MNALRTIRERIGATQAELGAALQVSQSNVSFYEKGQTVPPDVAAKLIDFAKGRGLVLSYDHVYGASPVPELTKPKRRKGSQPVEEV